jgi:hypothetical protein
MHSEGQLFAGRFARQPEPTWHRGATRASLAWADLSDPAFGAVCAFSFLGLSNSLALLDDSSKNETVISELLNAEVALLQLQPGIQPASRPASRAKSKGHAKS